MASSSSLEINYPQKLRLLCFDGGGIRGYASLIVLKRLMSRTDLRPCEYFDMICGTSTGGLIAIMLGRLEMTINECISAYVGMMDGIFDKKAKLPFDIFSGKVQARYNTDTLTESIKNVIRNAGYDADAKLRGPKRHLSKAKTFVVALDEATSDTVVFTDYEKEGQLEMWQNVKIWEAACATTAAISYFKPCEIMSAGVYRKFTDGALGDNNPVNKLCEEAEEQFSEGNALEPSILCILSIGTGRRPYENFGRSLKKAVESIAKVATATERTHETFVRGHRPLVARKGYFRFNPLYIDVELDEAGKRDNVEARTEAYLTEPATVQYIKDYQAISDESQVTPPIRLHHIKSSRKRFFYELDQNYLRKGVNSYWHYLTIDSYEMYKRIYTECADPRTNRVAFKTFLQQFRPDWSNPSRDKIETVWARTLNRDDPAQAKIENSSHPKSLVMATLYMLHIEKCTQWGLPEDCNRNALLRFDRWDPCLCKNNCGRSWNWVSQVGIHRGGDAKIECGIEQYLKSTPFQRNFQRANKDALARMRGAWDIARKKK